MKRQDKEQHTEMTQFLNFLMLGAAAVLTPVVN